MPMVARLGMVERILALAIYLIMVLVAAAMFVQEAVHSSPDTAEESAGMHARGDLIKPDDLDDFHSGFER